MARVTSKPSFDVWLRWAEVLCQRLEAVYQVYEDHGAHDKATRAVIGLSRLHSILAGKLAQHLSVLPYAQLQQMTAGGNRFEEAQITALTGIFHTALRELPDISKDMQKLLKSSWHGECNGRLASDLFKGPRGSVNEGIGSGLARDGMLPMALEQLLQQEQMGGIRTPSQTGLSAEQQQRWMETSRRWAARNSVHLRRAGRVE